jgi:hypothetical protein
MWAREELVVKIQARPADLAKELAVEQAGLVALAGMVLLKLSFPVLQVHFQASGVFAPLLPLD